MAFPRKPSYASALNLRRQPWRKWLAAAGVVLVIGAIAVAIEAAGYWPEDWVTGSSGLGSRLKDCDEWSAGHLPACQEQ